MDSPEKNTINRTFSLQDLQLQQEIAENIRQKTPPRMMGERGSGAFGKFTVTADISDLTSANIFSKIGNSCKIFVRFSSLFSGNPKYDAVGFSVRFYTEEGSWDIAGSSFPVFLLKNAQKFPKLMQVTGLNPQTNLYNREAFWNFCGNNPETLHELLMLMSERGTTKSYLNCDGFSGHTFAMINEKREKTWVKFHFKHQQNLEIETNCEDLHEDFCRNIESGNFPKWKVFIQTMSAEQAQEYRWNPFDATKVWLKNEFPLKEIGEIELNELPENYNETVEQAAFSPANLIPGIGFSPDAILQARLSAYADAHRYRMGNHYQKLEVNSGNSKPETIGQEFLNDEFEEFRLLNLANYDSEDDHYTQPGLFYTKALKTPQERETLIKNITADMQQMRSEMKDEIIYRQLCHFFRANIEMGMKIAAGLKVNIDGNIMNHAQ